MLLGRAWRQDAARWQETESSSHPHSIIIIIPFASSSSSSSISSPYYWELDANNTSTSLS